MISRHFGWSPDTSSRGADIDLAPTSKSVHRTVVALGLALGLSLSGCAARQGPPTMESIARAIAGLGEEELWLCGKAAVQAEEYLRAAMCFSLLADRFPDSPKWRQATLGAGEAWERQEDWQRALERYLAAYDPEADDALALTWKISTAFYELDLYQEAIDLLEPLIGREDLSLTDRIRAQTWTGVCKLELGDWEDAEMEFRRALFVYQRRKSEERVDPYFPAQAQFFLGEIYRRHFEDVSIDQTDDVPRLSETIEKKSEYLLSAQGHYVRTVRFGHPHWATAAGQRIGQLYERLYDEMIEAPIPSSLTPEQAELYRLEVRRKVRILVKKAIAAYERTLTVAERIGLDTAFVDKTRAGLRRMEQLLLEDLGDDHLVDEPSEQAEEEGDPEEARGSASARGGEE